MEIWEWPGGKKPNILLRIGTVHPRNYHHCLWTQRSYCEFIPVFSQLQIQHCRVNTSDWSNCDLVARRVSAESMSNPSASRIGDKGMIAYSTCCKQFLQNQGGELEVEPPKKEQSPLYQSWLHFDTFKNSYHLYCFLLFPLRLLFFFWPWSVTGRILVPWARIEPELMAVRALGSDPCVAKKVPAFFKWI